MDRTVTCRRIAAAAVLTVYAALAHAQAGDPTLPPPNLLPTAEGEATKPAAPSGPELQSVLVSREAGGRRLAVISGETVREGGRFHGAVVERVRENEVVLRRGRARQVLKLYDSAAK